MPDLSILIVNYNSTDYLLGLLDSLEGQHFSFNGAEGSKEILVADNGSKDEEVEKLKVLGNREGLRVIPTGKNLGYGGGINRVFEESSGSLILVLNPDILFLPGALDRMVKYLASHKDVAAVGPRCWMDRDSTVLHPPNRYPTVLRYLFLSMGHRYRLIGKLNSYLRSRYSVPIWQEKEPRKIEMLSGACFLTQREILDRIGFFDDRFPLYFEDTDLFRRMVRGGYRLMYLPESEIIHFYNRSAVQDYASAMERFKASEEHYYKKYYGGLGFKIYKRINRWVRNYVESHEPLTLGDMEDLGIITENPEFKLPREEGEFCMEIAGNALFTLAAAAFGKGSSYRLSNSMWQQLDAGFYSLRILKLPSLKTLRAWKFQKGFAAD